MNKPLTDWKAYTLRIERYVEAMSSIQRLEQMPVRINEYSYSLLHSELEETAKILAGALEPSVSAPDKGTIQLDHGLVLTVAENLIGNAARFAKSKLKFIWNGKETSCIYQLQTMGQAILWS